MGRVIVRSFLLLLFPQLTITGLGILGFRPPNLLIDGTCLNFLVSIIAYYSFFLRAKIQHLFESSKYLWEKENREGRGAALPI